MFLLFDISPTDIGLNVFNLIFYLFDMLLSMTSIIWSFLTQNIEIGSLNFTPLTLLGSGTLISLIILYLIKKFVPVA